MSSGIIQVSEQRRKPTHLSRSIWGQRFALLPAPAVTRSSTEVETDSFRSSAVRSSAQLIARGSAGYLVE